MRFYFYVIWFITFLSVAHATELTFTPATPTVPVGGQLTLTVSGTRGEVTWTPMHGQIQGSGTQVIYLAPAQASIDVVMVLDAEGNLGTVSIQVVPALAVTHLTFSRAAILILGGGDEEVNPHWATTQVIAQHIYRTLHDKGFSDAEIYYLSPSSWMDFNEDGQRDNIVDAPNPERPLVTTDIQEALAWANTLGKLEQPLSLFFIAGQGETDKWVLNSNQRLDASTLKPWLDDYQNTTGNSVVLVMDASYSGTLLKSLAAPQRGVISSTSAELEAQFSRNDKGKVIQGFSEFMVAGEGGSLLGGSSFGEAFKINMKNYSNQQPQLDDNGDGVSTNQDGQELSKVFLTPRIALGASLSLRAKATAWSGEVQQVWAELRMLLDEKDKTVPSLLLQRVNLSPTPEANLWEGLWNEVVYPSEYEVTLYATDQQGQVASSPPVKLQVTGVEIPFQPSIQVTLAKDTYQIGESFKAEVLERLSWKMDLYVAVILPSDSPPPQFIALTQLNQFAPLNQPSKWEAERWLEDSVTVLDLTLPVGLTPGQYCLLGILSPAKEDVFKMMNQKQWVTSEKCFGVVQ